MDPDNPALNADGSLKNAEEIQWDYSPTQPNRFLLPSVSKPTAPIFQFHNQLGPEHFSGLKRKLNEPVSVTKTMTSKSTESTCSKGKEGTIMKAKKNMNAVKLATVNHIKASSTPHTNQSSSPSVMAASNVAELDDKDADIHIKNKCKRGDGPADVLTMFELIDPDNVGAGYECQICM